MEFALWMEIISNVEIKIKQTIQEYILSLAGAIEVTEKQR
jgi:hypothetical protein